MGRDPRAHNASKAVVWRRANCRDSLLTVSLSPGGWFLYARSFRIPPDDWLQRAGYHDEDYYPTVTHRSEITMEGRARGDIAIPNLRILRGFRANLPLDQESWDTSRKFEIGCGHMLATVSLELVVEDCRSFRTGRRRVERMVRPEDVDRVT